MRDPDLVQRAERAAMALERAWGHWRVMHGLGTDPLPPVSSYVGYSLEEPWGQPRVVFGVGAEEAERLAALLAGHDCVGPVHAEVTARPDWRLAASCGPATAQGRPFEGAVSVPAQAPPPGAEPVAERDGRYLAGTTGAVGTDTAGTGLAEAQITDAGAAYGEPAYGGPAYNGPAYGGPAYGGPAYGDAAYGGFPDAGDAEGAEDADAEDAGFVSDEADPLAIHHERAGGDRADPDDAAADSPPGSWEHGEPAGNVHLAAVEQPGVIAFPRRPEQPADQWQEPIAATAPTSDNYDATPSQGPGYFGPRYQGVPPRYQPGPGQQDPPALFGAPPEEAGERTGAGEPAAGRPGAGESRVSEASASEASASQASVSEASVSEASAGQPTVLRPKAGPSRASQPGGGEPKAMQSSAAQSRVAQSKARQPGVRQSRARDLGADPAEAAPSGAVQSGDGQSGGQPETGQPRVAQSRAVQPKAVQPKAVQPKAVQSKDGQSRQTSRPSSPGRATGRDAGKRPRG
jgi:hypothetical protein